MASGKRRFGVPLVLVTASLALGLLLAEGALRLFPGLLSERARLELHWAANESPDGLTIPHPTIGAVAQPGLVKTLEFVDLSFTYEIDEHGFRNRGPWPRTADVVVVGDSLAFGYGVDEGETWTDLLAQRLEGVRVVNLGIVGTAPAQYTAAYEAFGVPLRPAVLLYCLFLGNDAYDTRMFQRWLDTGAGGNFAVWKHFGGRFPGAVGGARKLLEQSHLVTFLRELRKPERFANRTVDLKGGGRVQLVPEFTARACVGPGDEEFAAMTAAIQRAASRAAQEETRLLVVLFPTKEEVYLPALGEESPSPIAPFRRWMDEQGLPYLDLTPALSEAAAAGEQVYFEIDGHPNARGYEVVAGAVAGHLAEHPERYGL